MTTFTASEVRTTAHKWPNWRVGDMLHAYADRLESDEKAVPVYQFSIYNKRGELEWMTCSKLSFDKQPEESRRILYTHPAPAGAERLADQRDDAFQQAVQESRRVWMDEFPCEAGHDHVTPFDQFLYGNRPCVEAQPPSDAEGLEELGRILRGAMIQGDARVIGKNELKHALEILAAHSAQTQPPAAVEQSDWPEELMLRDTGIHDDQGGLGQRIFTTAGAGYKKVKYVRADLLQVGQCEPHTPAASVQDAKDAARYRWLRDHSGRDGQPYIRCDDPPFEPMDYWITAGTADAAIDAAMAKESGR